MLQHDRGLGMALGHLEHAVVVVEGDHQVDGAAAGDEGVVALGPLGREDARPVGQVAHTAEVGELGLLREHVGSGRIRQVARSHDGVGPAVAIGQALQPRRLRHRTALG